jgi:hypothetical protein
LVFCSCTRFWHLVRCSTIRLPWDLPIPRLAVAVGVEVDGAAPHWGMYGRLAQHHRAMSPGRVRRSLVARGLAARQGWGVPNRQALAARRFVPAGDGLPVSVLGAQAHWGVAGQDRVNAASKGK